MSVVPAALLLCLAVSRVGCTGSFVTVFSGVVCLLDRSFVAVFRGGAGAAFLGVRAYAP